MSVDAISHFLPAEWRLLETGFLDGATNMAIDEAILKATIEGIVPPTLRLYGWKPACVSLGYNQAIAEIDLERCRRDGVDWVRRPTGGRAILHIDELTYSVVIAQSDPRAAGGVVESYRGLSRGLVAGLQSLGLEVAQAIYQENAPQKQTLSAACFDVPSHYEITVNGRKLVGSAQMRRQGYILQHGTLPLTGDITRLVRYLAVTSEEERERLRHKLVGRATTLEEALGRPIGFEEAGRAITQGFAQALKVTLRAGRLTPQEQAWATELRATRYANPSYTNQR